MYSSQNQVQDFGYLKKKERRMGEWRMGIYVVQQSQLKVEGVNVEE